MDKRNIRKILSAGGTLNLEDKEVLRVTREILEAAKEDIHLKAEWNLYRAAAFYLSVIEDPTEATKNKLTAADRLSSLMKLDQEQEKQSVDDKLKAVMEKMRKRREGKEC